MLKYFVLIFKLFCFQFEKIDSSSNKIFRSLRYLYVDKYYKKHSDLFRKEPKNDVKELFSIVHRIDTVVFIIDYYTSEVRFRAKMFPSLNDDLIHLKNDKLNFHKEMIYIVKHLGMFDQLISNIPELAFFHIAAKGISDLQDSIPMLTSRKRNLEKLWTDYQIVNKKIEYKEEEDWVELKWSGSKVKVNYKSYLEELIETNNQQPRNYVYTNFKKIVFPFYDYDNLPISLLKTTFKDEFDYIKNKFKDFIELENYDYDRCGDCDRLLYFSDVRCNRNGFLAHKSCMSAPLGLTENCSQFLELKNKKLDRKIQEFHQAQSISNDIPRGRPLINLKLFHLDSTQVVQINFTNLQMFMKGKDNYNQKGNIQIDNKPDIYKNASNCYAGLITNENASEEKSHQQLHG